MPFGYWFSSFEGAVDSSDAEDETAKEEAPKEPVDEGDENSTYYISNADELSTLKRKGTYILTADIDMTGREWTPVGTYSAPFIGTLNGNGFTIKGLTVTKDTEGEGECISYTYTYAGLIGYAENATITALKLEDINIAINSSAKTRVVYASAIAAMTKNTVITDCHVISGSITSASPLFKAYSAGITAFSFDSDFIGCTVNADIAVTSSNVTSVAGGILAHAAMNTQTGACSVLGSVSALSIDGNAYTGGIVGYSNNSDISNCAVNADVKAETQCNDYETGKAGASYAGGILGYHSNTLTNQKNISAVSSSGTVTALSADYVSYAGGICAYMAYASLTQGYSTSTIVSDSDTREAFSGGIIGYLSTKSNISGMFFAGSLNVNTTRDIARTGIIVAFDATEDTTTPTTIENCGYLELSSLSVTINGKKYSAENKLPEKERFTSHGEDYEAASLKSRNILTSDLKWNSDDWSFSISDYPTVTLRNTFSTENG